MFEIDLNSDLGESLGAWSMGDDAAMLDIVSSANVACGFHAGDPAGILATLKAYFETHKPSQFEAEMRLQYINSASTMGLRSLFSLFNDAGQRGTDVRVLWTYDAEDDAIEELGTDLVEDFHNVLLEHQPINT